MTRDEVLELIREHLADELELDPARITESTHFRNDLQADSLDLYTLVQELEDTYGVKMSDEEAQQIWTVGAGRRLRARASSVRGRGRSRRPRAGILTPAHAARPAGAAAGRPGPAGGHARVVGRPPRGRVRAAGLPGRLRARPGGHHAPVSAAGEPRRRAADEDPRAGGLGPLVPGGRRAPGHPRAAARGGAAGARRAGHAAARADRAGAGLGDRGRDRRVLPRVRLPEDGRRGGRGVRARDRRGAGEPGGLQVGAAGASGAARGGRGLPRDGRGGAAARAALRGLGDGRRAVARPGAGRSKKDAEQAAAEAALETLEH